MVIVDAVTAAGSPGDVRIYEGDELERLPVAPRVSPHDPAVSEALAVARLAARGPLDVCLVGAVPGSLELGADLSPRMRAAADAAADIVRRRIEELGLEVRPRGTETLEQDWWVRTTAGGRR